MTTINKVIEKSTKTADSSSNSIVKTQMNLNDQLAARQKSLNERTAATQIENKAKLDAKERRDTDLAAAIIEDCEFRKKARTAHEEMSLRTVTALERSADTFVKFLEFSMSQAPK